jgi:uncharacterized protein YegL
MNSMKDFTVATARPLPVIVLADCSGSMSADGKISSLNQALAEMVRTFAHLDAASAEVHVAIITFGGSTGVAQPLQPASRIQLQSMTAHGGTPLGAALDLAANLLEDRDAIPSRAYRPTVILVSDGQPTDQWTGPLARFAEGTRPGKAERMALAIGADADVEMLKQFLGGSERQVFHASDAARIHSFFKFVTNSVSQRSRSANPSDIVRLLPPADLERL